MDLSLWEEWNEERLLQGDQTAAFREFARWIRQLARVTEEGLHEIRKEQKREADAIAKWPATCAEHRLELERRVSNGKAPGQKRTVSIGGFPVKLQTIVFSVLGAGVLFMGGLLALAYFILKVAPGLGL